MIEVIDKDDESYFDNDKRQPLKNVKKPGLAMRQRARNEDYLDKKKTITFVYFYC